MWTTNLAAVPTIVVAVTAGVVLALERGRRADAAGAAAAAVIGLVSALVASMLLWARGPESAAAVDVDVFASGFHVVFCLIGLFTVTVMPVSRRGEAHGPETPRHLTFVLLALVGMMVAASARDLVTAIVGVQAAWLASLIAAGLGRGREAATEFTFKGVIVGAVVLGAWWYGAALAYAIAGTTRLEVLAARIAASSLDPNILVLVAMVLLLAGMSFVVAAVPFHLWSADACEGTDAVTAGFVTTGIRVTGFAVMLRVLLTALEPLRIEWLPVVSAVAGLSMIVGAVVAVAQSNVRRLIAHIGVAHAGCLIVGLAAASQAGKTAVLFALVSWAVANMGALTALGALSADRRYGEVRDFAGLGDERPVVAAALAVCLLSLAGLPPSMGFVSKWLVLSAALQEGLVSMAVITAVTSVVLAFACLRLVVQMYMTNAHGPRRRTIVRRRRLAGALVAAAVLVAGGLWPGPALAAMFLTAASIF